MKRDLQWFIDFFEAIPKDKWTTKEFKRSNKFCALGHLGCRNNVIDDKNELYNNLSALLGVYHTHKLIRVNDNDEKLFSMYGKNPRERVINYLKTLQKQGVIT